MWPRWTISLRPCHLSMPQHCLMPLWYTSIFHPRSLNDFLSGSDASRISVAQCSASPSEWTILKTLMKPYWRRWTILPSEGMSISEIWRLYVWSGSTNRLDLRRVHQCHFRKRINFRLSILEYHESKRTQFGWNFRSAAARSISLKWSFLFFPSFSG